MFDAECICRKRSLSKRIGFCVMMNGAMMKRVNAVELAAKALLMHEALLIFVC